jgi:hypothetical protein
VTPGDDTCSWCEQKSEGNLILKPGRGSKPPKTAPACPAHIKHFNAKGVLTTQQAIRGSREDVAR